MSALADPGLFWVGSQLVDARTAKITGGTAASIQPGVRVQATGALSNGIFVATKVKIGGGD